MDLEEACNSAYASGCDTGFSSGQVYSSVYADRHNSRIATTHFGCKVTLVSDNKDNDDKNPDNALLDWDIEDRYNGNDDNHGTNIHDKW